MKFVYEVDPEVVAKLNNEWVPIEAIRFRFGADQTVEIDMTTSYYNAKVVEQFLEPNNGKAILYEGRLPL